VVAIFLLLTAYFQSLKLALVVVLVLPSLFAVVQGWAGTRSPSLDPDDEQSAYYERKLATDEHR
jgi:hypothetical protein